MMILMPLPLLHVPPFRQKNIDSDRSIPSSLHFGEYEEEALHDAAEAGLSGLVFLVRR